MYYDIQHFTVKNNYTLSVTFTDGRTGVVRFDPQFFSGVFAPLKEKAVFEAVCIDDGALSWPGYADIAPDALYKTIVEKGEALLQ